MLCNLAGRRRRSAWPQVSCLDRHRSNAISHVHGEGVEVLSGPLGFFQRREGTFAALAFLLVVVGLSSLFGIFNGFNGETGLIYPSDVHQGLAGFIYGDPLRKFTSLFYHLSYVLGSAVGERGSFVPYQVVYAALWVLRSVLTYLLVKQLMPERPALALFAGLFAAMHTADGALNWIGQLNQFGFIFLMLLSFVALVRAVESNSIARATALTTASVGAAYLSLWSYESPLPVMLAFPFAVAILRRDLARRRLLWVFGVYLVPIIAFIAENAHRYLTNAGNGTYQIAVSRASFSPLALMSDLALHLTNSVAFWLWPHTSFQAERSQDYVMAFVPVIAAILILIPVAVYLESRSSKPFHIDVHLLLFACLSIGLLIASHLVILVLRDNRNLWRTEFLPGFAAAWLMGATLYALLVLVPGNVPRTILAIVAFATVGAFATRAGVNSALYFHALWERHRIIVSSIIANAPRVADGTLIVIRNINPQNNPFGADMWLDHALHLAYPRTMVAGIYFFQDGSSAPDTSISMDGGEPHLLSTGSQTLFHSAASIPINHVMLFDDDPLTGQAVPVAMGPVSVGKSMLRVPGYDFCAPITGTTPAVIAIRRYGPIESRDRIFCSKEALR
jgi:hypothetical protein